MNSVSSQLSRAAALVLLFGGLSHGAEQARFAVSDFDVVRMWAVQDLGRVKPFDTFARNVLRGLTGKESFSPQDPETRAVLAPSGDAVEGVLSMIFDPQAWMRVGLVRIKNQALKRELGLDFDRTHYSIDELRANTKFMELSHSIIDRKRRGVDKFNEVENKCMELMHQINTFHALVEGESLLLVPPRDIIDVYEEAHWSPLAHPEGVDATMASALRAKFMDLGDAYLAKEKERFHAIAAQLGTSLAALAPHNYPSAALLQWEVHYNRLAPFHTASVIYLLAFLLWLIALGVNRGTATAFAWAVLLIGFVIHTYGFLLRVYISGRAPVSNMYESMVFLAWGMIVFAMLFEWIYRSRYFALSSSAVAAVVIIMSHVLPVDPGIGVLVPVLRSNFWLIIHVMTIMLSYSAFAVAWALGHVMLLQVIINPRNIAVIGPTCNFVYRAIQVGVILIAAGTILGGVWANYSWGRFWGWDPKETWALICLLGYLAILHARFTGWLDTFGMAAASVLAFMLVVMCYYGVNFVLASGLHSYGRGSGGLEIALTYVALDSLFVAVAVARWHMAGRPRISMRQAASPHTTINAPAS